MTERRSPCEPEVLGPLTSAKKDLADLLPPQPDKIVSALQHVELALQYSSIEGKDDETLDLCRDALRALDQIDGRVKLPAKVSGAIATARNKITEAIRAIDVGA